MVYNETFDWKKRKRLLVGRSVILLLSNYPKGYWNPVLVVTSLFVQDQIPHEVSRRATPKLVKSRNIAAAFSLQFSRLSVNAIGMEQNINLENRYYKLILFEYNDSDHHFIKFNSKQKPFFFVSN